MFAQYGIAPTLQIDGRVFTDLANLIVVRGHIQNATNKYSSFRKPNGVAGYTPSGSKSFRCLAARFIFAASGQVILGYSDNDLGVNSTTVPTNEVYLGGNVDAGVVAAAGTVGTMYEYSLNFLIPNGKYLNMQTDASAAHVTMQVFGYEE